MTKLTKETEDVVAELIERLREGDDLHSRIEAADRIAEDTTTIKLQAQRLMELSSEIVGLRSERQSLSDRIDVLEGALREIAETLFVPYGEAETISEMKHIARASLIKEGGR